MNSLRLTTLAGLALLSLIASAESYIGTVYNPPAGFGEMWAEGAGDNGMATGTAMTSGGIERAAYVTPNGFRDMNPPGWTSSILDSWGSTYHVGFGSSSSTDNFRHALYWVGGSNAPTDLHPLAAQEESESFANGGAGQVQVGRFQGFIGGVNYFTACMWSRTASSFKMLTSPGHQDTHAIDTDGVVQVGYGWSQSALQTHALRWRGPGSNPVDMHPAGAGMSQAHAVGGSQIGGFTCPSSAYDPRAALWTMTSTHTAYTNLHPAPFSTSLVKAVRNGVQAGHGRTIGTQRDQAILWHGSAATWTNLHSKLPIIYQTWASYATDIDNQGNVVGYVKQPNGPRRAVIWKRQP